MWRRRSGCFGHPSCPWRSRAFPAYDAPAGVLQMSEAANLLLLLTLAGCDLAVADWRDDTSWELVAG